MKKKFINPTLNPCFSVQEISTPSTISIPLHLYRDFHRKVVIHKSLPKYLTHLIRSYRFLILNGIIQPCGNVKTRYQKENLELIRINFRPIQRDWAELKCLRFSLNCSISWIIVFLLELDLQSIPDIPKFVLRLLLPTKRNSSLEVGGILGLKEKNYTRSLYLRPG